MGLTMTGIGLGGMIWPPTAQWLISSYSWQQAYIILGLATLIGIIPAAQFMKHSPQRAGQKPYGENETISEDTYTSIEDGLSLKQTIKTGRLWIFALILFCSLFNGQTILVHIVPYAIDTGITSLVAAGIMSTIAMVGIIGRFSVGFLSDKVGPRIVLTSCLFVFILALTWLLFTKDVWMFYAFAMVFGIGMGFFTPIIPLVTAELFDLKFLGTISATIMFLGTMGGAIGVPLAGTIFDMSGDYRLAFLICVIFVALAATFSLFLLRSKSYQNILVGE